MKGGRIHLFDQRCRARTEDRFGQFTAAIPTADSMAPREIWLLGLSDEPDTVELVAIANRGPKITTFERRVRLSSFIEFEPVQLAHIQELMPKKLRPHFRTGVNPPATWEAIEAALVEIRPDLRSELDSLRQSLDEDTWLGHGVFALEKDAVGVALGLSGLDRRAISRWDANQGNVSFLEGLEAARLREDQIVQHDATVFGDWKFLRKVQSGAAVFEQGGSRLTVINVNRTPVEKTLGVDPIYFSHRHSSFIVVQYKNFRQEGDAWVYRPDQALKKETERMHAISSSAWDGVPADFRLSADPRFLKFCQPVTFSPSSTELMRGHYVPLELWLAWFKEGTLKGPKGGLALYENDIERSLTNTDFIALCSKGWVGSRGTSTSAISAAIHEGLEANHSVVLASFKERTSSIEGDSGGASNPSPSVFEIDEIFG